MHSREDKFSFQFRLVQRLLNIPQPKMESQLSKLFKILKNDYPNSVTCSETPKPDIHRITHFFLVFISFKNREYVRCIKSHIRNLMMEKELAHN